MTGKKLTKNLIQFLSPFFTIPVYSFDRIQQREVPCIVVGYTKEDLKVGLPGHYTIEGFCKVVFQGYDDSNNVQSDAIATDLSNILTNRSALETALNKPLSGTDTRSMSGCYLYQLFLEDVDREDDDHSTVISLNFRAITANCD